MKRMHILYAQMHVKHTLNAKKCLHTAVSLPVHITAQDEIQLETRLQCVAIFFFFQCEFFISDSC